MIGRMTTDDLPVVEVIGLGYQARGRLLNSARQRVSDHINEQRHMLLLADAHLEGIPAFGTGASELGVSRDEAILVLPTHEPVESRDLRIVKERHRVRVVAGEWLIQGDLHVVPGVALERFVNVGQEDFIPITDATIEGPDGERQVSTVLVQRHHIRLLSPTADPTVVLEGTRAERLAV